MKIPTGAPAYVQAVKVNNETMPSVCSLDFYDTFRIGADIEIILTDDKDSANDCGAAVPQSLSTGGFSSTR